MRAATLTDDPYQMPLGFDLKAFVHDALTVMRGGPIDVTLRFDKATAAWAKDCLWHPSHSLKSDLPCHTPRVNSLNSIIEH